MSHKKICIFTPMIYPVPAIRGGAVEGLVELLMRMNEKYKEMDLTVVSVYDEKAREVSDKYSNCKFIWVNRNGKWDKFWSSKFFIYLNKIGIKLWGETIVPMPFVKRAWREIKDEIFDAYILEGGGDCYNFGYLHKKIPSNKFLVHFHGEVAGDKAIRKWFGRYITVSNYIGRRLVCNGEVDKNILRVLPNCFDNTSMVSHLDKVSVRKKYNLTQDDFIFVYWGRLIPEKGVLDLVKAFERISGELVNTKLLIVGNANFGYGSKTKYDEMLAEICMKDELRERVVFTGFVNHDDMGSLLEACDVGIIPSIWDDPAPLTIFEGLSKGLLLLSTRVGGIPEVVKDGVNGIILDWNANFSDSLARKMKDIYLNYADYSQIGETAKNSVLEYTPDRYYWNYLNIIRELDKPVIKEE